MTITVEDGSIVANANSYATVQELRDYATARGYDLCVTDEAAENLLIKAMDYIDAKFGARFQGTRVQRTQSLSWPRAGAYLDGYLIPSDEIPRNVQYGQLAAAVEANTSDLLENVTPAVKREKVDVIEVEYTNSGKVTSVSAFAKADALLLPLCKRGGLTAVRA